MDTLLAALDHDCPFCGAAAGQPCRTRNKAGRPGGREQDRPHSRRIAMTTPVEDRRRPTRVDALCCACGLHRTVSSNHYGGWQDPNNAHSPANADRGWKRTKTLKCDACGERTRHAVLSYVDSKWRYSDEEQQQ